MVDPSKIEVVVASEEHIKYVDEILDTINRAAKVRGTGIAKRSPEYVKQKMLERKAVVALCEGEFAGFSYIECWSNKEFVANSGLIVADKYRGIGCIWLHASSDESSGFRERCSPMPRYFLSLREPQL